MTESNYVEGSLLWERYKDRGQYLQRRRQVEHWLHQRFIALGGAPQESFPIYMVLGRPKWMAAEANPCTLATTAEIEVPLSLDVQVPGTVPAGHLMAGASRDQWPGVTVTW